MSFGSVYVSFSMPSDGGSPIIAYQATAFINGVSTGITATGFASPILFDMSLQTGVIYTFEVLATNAVGSGPESAPSNAVEPAVPPDPPTAVTATPGNASVSVAFLAPADDGGSPIIQYLATAYLSSQIQPLPNVQQTGTGSPIVIANLTNGSSYNVFVQAQNAIGYGQPGDASGSVTPVASVPSPPLSLIATAGNAQASVSFTLPSSTGGSPIINYTVRPTPATSPATFTGAAPPIICSPLVNETSYTFTAVATNSAGSSAASAPSNAVIPAAALPGAPTGVSATPGNAQATVTFTPPTNTGSGITGYTVTPNPATSPATFTGSGPPIICTNLTNGTPYTFSVVANTANGSGAAGTTPSSVTPFANVPSAPTNPIASLLGSGSVKVTFGAPTSTGGATILSYTVTSAGTPPDATPIVVTTTTMPPPTTVNLTGLTNGTSYTFTVIAANSAGSSLPSTSSNAVTPVAVPSAPIAVTAVPHNGYATVSWTAPASTGGSALISYTAFSGTFKTTVTGSPPPTTANVTGLTNGVGYAFEVYATNAAGSSVNSAPSSTVVPYTVPGVATGLSASPGNASATLYFTAPSGNGASITGYTVYFSGGGVAATGTASPIAIGGLTNGTTYAFYIVATNAAGNGGQSATSNSVIPYVPAASALVALTSAVLPSVYQNEAYSFSFICAGGVAPYSVTDYHATPNTGNWVNISSKGLLTGFCTVAETETITVSFADSSGLTATQTFTLTVLPVSGALRFTSTGTLPSAPKNGSYFYQLGIAGGTPPYYVNLGTATGANAGKWFTTASAISHFLTGTPTVAEASNSLPLTVIDTLGATATTTVSVPVVATLMILGTSQDLSSQPLPQAMKGNAYSFTLSAVGGTNAGYQWSAASGALPAGLSLSTAGVITGTPTATGNFSVTFQVEDNGTNTAQFLFTLFVQQNCNVTRPSYNTGTGFFFYNGQLHDPTGAPFRARGVNLNHFDSSSQTAVAHTKSNIMRYGLYTLDIYGGESNATYVAGIQSYVNAGAGLLPNVGVFYVAAGGTTNNSAAVYLAQAVTYWYDSYGDYAAVRNSMMMNVCNEWGQSPTWQAWYPAVIATITKISGATIYFSSSGNANPFANAVGLGIAAIAGAGGVANQLITVTGVGGTPNAFYITANATIAGTYTSGGTINGGAIGIIRAAGWTVPISVDGPADAGDMASILAYGPAIANSDPQKNTCISFHGYSSMYANCSGITGITKGASTKVNYSFPTVFNAGFSGAPYFHNAYFTGVDGMTQLNNQNILNVNSYNDGFVLTVPVNSNPYSNYTGGGYVYDSGQYYRIILSQFANLQMQNVAVMMEEFTCSCPPRSNGTAGPTSVGGSLATRECDAQFINWTYWAIDDHTTQGANQNAWFQIVLNTSVYNVPTDLTIGGLDIVLNPLYGLQYQTVPPSSFL